MGLQPKLVDPHFAVGILYTLYMYEFVAHAVVLTKEPVREQDARVSLVVEGHGKLVARVRSARKITSKLSGHLEPGNLVSVRLVEQRGLHAVDALTMRAKLCTPADGMFLDSLMPEGEPDDELFALLTNGAFSWVSALRILGWDPTHAPCVRCAQARGIAFHIESQDFFCASCIPPRVSSHLLRFA